MKRETKRLSVLKGATLDADLDEILQQLVSEAARISGFPISLITLVLNRVQFFRAHIGLPEELAIARATDRCVSFCQFVIQENKPLMIEDAKLDPSLPTELVDRWGIRSYFGFPVTLDGEAIGSLCVIDTVPRKLPIGAELQMKVLAEQASARLKELQSFASSKASDNSLLSIKGTQDKMLEHLKETYQKAVISMTDLTPITQIVKLISPEKHLDPRFSNVISVLKEGIKAHDDLQSHILDIGVLLDRLEKQKEDKK